MCKLILSVGSKTWSAYAYVTLSVSVKMASHLGSKVLYPYQLDLVSTHVFFIRITILVFDSVIKRHASLLVLVLDHHSFSRNCGK